MRHRRRCRSSYSCVAIGILLPFAERGKAPFLGQGLQMGMRDVANLAWRLPLVLRGHASDKLLDDYSSERRPPCRFLIDLAVQLGKVICVETDEEAKVVHAQLRQQSAFSAAYPLDAF